MAVLGGGVVGLLCAHYLLELGAEVVVVDKASMGSGCSLGNMGWICPSIATPLPAPGLTLQSLRWLTRVDSPLYVKPGAIPRLAGWLRAFRRHCNAESHARGVAALGLLTERTPELYDGLRARGIHFEEGRAGLLLAYDDPAKLDAAAQELSATRRFGVGPIEALDRAALVEREPALTGGLVGGLLVSSDRHVRPESLTAGVSSSIAERGAELVEGAAVTGFEVDGRRVRAAQVVRGDGGRVEIEADAFVLAAGAETGLMSFQLGIELPIQAGKGYSITVEDPAVTVSQPTYFAGSKVGLTPFAGAHRVAGTMELSGINRTLDRRRLVNLERAVARFIPGALDGGARTEWVGMRPLTPDGLPAIGMLPSRDNAFVATGHQMLGVTLAPATGYALAHLVCNGCSPIALQAFDPARFVRP